MGSTRTTPVSKKSGRPIRSATPMLIQGVAAGGQIRNADSASAPAPAGKLQHCTKRKTECHDEARATKQVACALLNRRHSFAHWHANQNAHRKRAAQEREKWMEAQADDQNDRCCDADYGRENKPRLDAHQRSLASDTNPIASARALPFIQCSSPDSCRSPARQPVQQIFRETSARKGKRRRTYRYSRKSVQQITFSRSETRRWFGPGR